MTSTAARDHEPDLMDPALLADPLGVYGQVREEGAVRRGRTPDGAPAWYVTRAAEVRTLLADPRFVTSATALPAEHARENVLALPGVSPRLARHINATLLDVDGPEHARLRKLVSRAFTARRVAELRPRVAAITDALLDGLGTGSGEPVDLIAALAHPLPITVICELVGVPEADRASWRRWSGDIMSMDPVRVPEALAAMDAHVRELAGLRRERPAGDLLTALVQAHDGGDRLTEDELVTMVVTLVIAGHETTAHLLGNAVVGLLAHPDQLRRLQREPDGWPAAVAELMRLWTPVHVVRVRYATEDVELGGVTVRAGDVLVPVLIAANTDPRERPDPDTLDITRPTGRGENHVGFGHGPHYCLGAALARLEAEVALAALFRRFPDLALAAEPAWLPFPGMRRTAQLPVRPRG